MTHVLPKLITATENFRRSANHFDCALQYPSHGRIKKVIDQMLSVIAGIIVVLSIAILAAHALEAFRSD
jgi:t-SNARE complex subunit (syntaxin)